MNQNQWILCPVCRGKTRLKIRDDTVLKYDYNHDQRARHKDAEPITAFKMRLSAFLIKRRHLINENSITVFETL